MRSFATIFWLEVTSLVRSKTLAMLTLASVAWMVALPHLATGDGTAEGARELWIRYSLGGVFALLIVALLASATGAIAREREAKRLALTTVRPVPYIVIVLAKASALVGVGALVLAIACAVLPLSSQTELSRPCSHLLRPLLPSPRVEAEAMYETYLRDPATPEAVRKAKKDVVLRILENRAIDHYFPVKTNHLARWRFDLPSALPEVLRVRVRFAGLYDSRQDACGIFRLGDRQGVVSNLTQMVLDVPLSSGDVCAGTMNELTFENRGHETLMLRPRKDIELLLLADTFGWNLVRAYLEMVGILALIVSFGLFLSASLGRPVALFVAMVTLLVSEISPSVVEQSPEELDARLADRIGLALTRAAAEVSRPVSALDPIARLATDICIERHEVERVLLLDLVLGGVFFALLSAWLLPHKPLTPP